MKTIAALMLSTSLAFAGGLPLEIPAEAPLIVPEGAEQMGGSGAWLIPLMAIALIAIAVNSSDDDPDEPDGCEQDCNPPPEPCDKYCAISDTYGEQYGASKDAWKDLPKDDQADVRAYWELTGGHDGIGDWSQYPEWLEGQ